tara:strand:- start:2879 stop:3064 length:186 start_codon:yes stop_codon:yes gene_type:complete
MEQSWYVESQIKKAKEMIRSRDMQFSNLYRQVIKNKKDIEKIIELLELNIEIRSENEHDKR